MCIRHLFRNKWGSWRSEEGAERGRVMPVFVQVKCEGRWGVLCVRNCGAITESACAVRGWVLHRLNRLGATAAFLQEWGSAFWANSGMSLRAGEWVRGPVSARLCAAFVELSRTRWREGWFYSGFFGTCTHKHMHSNKLSRHFSLRKSCVLMQLHPTRVSTGWYLLQFMGVCLFLCLCVRRVGSIVSAHCWRFFSLLTCCWHLGASYCHRNLRPPSCIWKLEVLAFLHRWYTVGAKRLMAFYNLNCFVVFTLGL